MTAYLKFHVGLPLLFAFLIGILHFGATSVVAAPLAAPLLVFNCTAVTTIPAAECEALVTIYTTMGGEGWYKPLRPESIYPRATWLQLANPCDWYGVGCEDGHVQRLVLDLEGMIGSFPPETQSLTQLQSLLLHNENVLPDGIYLPALTELNLVGAYAIPATIANLPALQELKTRYGYISMIDPAIGQLANLQRLSLGINDLQEPIPTELGLLVGLQALTLTRTSAVTTPITLPATFGNLHNLSTLKIYGLVATFPDTFGNLRNLEHLELLGNPLHTLPGSFADLQSLRWLLLIDNQLATLPASIGNLSNLIFLDLHYNHLTTVPAEIGNLTKLERLRLDNNQLQTLPATIGNLSNLNTLELHENQLTALPPAIGNLTKLTVLKLARNQLSTLPAEIGNLTALLDIQLYANQLTALPATFEQLDAITALELQNNHLTAYPPAINGMDNLESVWLNDNDLRFLPVDLTLPPKLKQLGLARNRDLIGPIPASFTQLTAVDLVYTNLCADDDAAFQRWLEEATDGNGYYPQLCPKLTVDVSTGAPGSQFTLTGIHFGSSCCISKTVTVTVNSEVLGTFLLGNATQFTATLTTSDTVEGRYVINAAYGIPGWTYRIVPQVTLTLAADAPLNSPTPVAQQFALPPALIYDNFIYLPHLAR